jgi:glyoxylase-like metal-dependent hydrolase (beta-lactamase superfamily II)
MTFVKDLQDVLLKNEPKPPAAWKLRLISSGECLSYCVWNIDTKELLWVDPKKEDIGAYLQLNKELLGYLCLGVIDTHTHADHISAAAFVAEVFHAPLIMHFLSPSSRVHLRVTCMTSLPAHAAPLQFIPTPGHTQDGMCLIWGPFAFTGDTVLYGDVGRDDLPGGSPSAHYESLQKLTSLLPLEVLILPGHDNQRGRISSWATQLKINSSITQPREEYVQEAAAFEAPAPTLFKKSLVENFK